MKRQGPGTQGGSQELQCLSLAHARTVASRICPSPLLFIAGLRKQSPGWTLDTAVPPPCTLSILRLSLRQASSGKLAERDIFHALDSSGCAGALQPLLPLVTHTQKEGVLFGQPAVIHPPLGLKSFHLPGPQCSNLQISCSACTGWLQAVVPALERRMQKKSK